MDRAFSYFKDYGYCTEASYPYRASSAPFIDCKDKSCTKDAFTITGHTDVSAGSVSSL